MTSPGPALHTVVISELLREPERFPRNPNLHDSLVRLQNSALSVLRAQSGLTRWAGGEPFERSKQAVSTPRREDAAV